MEIHFRIIELKAHKVLITKDFDNDEEGSPTIQVCFFLEGVKVVQTLGYNDEDKRDSVFDEFTDDRAQEILDNTIELFNNG